MIKKIKIWFSPVPGVGLRGVILKKQFIGYKILFRDIDKKCCITNFILDDGFIYRDER